MSRYQKGINAGMFSQKMARMQIQKPDEAERKTVTVHTIYIHSSCNTPPLLLISKCSGGKEEKQETKEKEKTT